MPAASHKQSIYITKGRRASSNLARAPVLYVGRDIWRSSTSFMPTISREGGLESCNGRHARLQSSDCRIDPGILFLGVTVEVEKDQGSNDKHGSSRQAANPKLPAFFVDCCHDLLGTAPIF